MVVFYPHTNVVWSGVFDFNPPITTKEWSVLGWMRDNYK